MAVGGLIALGATVSLLTSPAGSATWSQLCALIFIALATFAGGCLAPRATTSLTGKTV
jgi:hypothetical protein